MLFLPAYARPVALIHDDPEPSPAKPGRLPPVTLHTFLGAVSFVYLLYLVSQLAYFFSAFRGILPEGYTQAEYARRGFFEMCALCSINLLMVIIAIGQVRREPKTPWLTKALCLFILVFSLVLAVCSASKMGMYIGAYGLTRLRVLTSVFMVCVAVALVCVAIWILAPRFPYMQIVVLAVLAVGCFTGWMDVDTQVARYNVDAYLSGQLTTVDVDHLGGLSEGAVPQLARLLEAPDPQVQAGSPAALADMLREHYRVDWENGAIVLGPGRSRCSAPGPGPSPRPCPCWRPWLQSCKRNYKSKANTAGPVPKIIWSRTGFCVWNPQLHRLRRATHIVQICQSSSRKTAPWNGRATV